MYRPRFQLDTRVMRVPILPGADPRQLYGDLAGRGVRGIVLEAFGVGAPGCGAALGVMPWLRWGAVVLEAFGVGAQAGVC